MKAIVHTKYGPPEVLRLVEVDKPSPKRNEVLIRVHATTVTAADWRMRKADPFIIRFITGLFRPMRKRILGIELAGEIEETGSDVTMFKNGDKVYAITGLRMGGYAQYKCLAEKKVALKPGNTSYEEAAAIPVGGVTALYNLRKANTHKGQRVLIYGASGSVGTYAVQLAKYYGAEVTAVCSEANFELVKSLGADKVIDYTKENFAESGTIYDIIFDGVGKITHGKAKKALAPNGKYVTVNKGLAIGKIGDLIFLRELVEAGKIKPVIDRRYSMEQIAEAHRYVESWRKRGNVAVTIK